MRPSGAAVMDRRHADAEYRTFPEFEDWSKSNVDTARWERYTSQLREGDQSSPDLLRRALEIVKQAPRWTLEQSKGSMKWIEGSH